jgi:hypothetical protein
MCNGCAEDFFKDNYQPVCPRDDCKEELTDEDGRPVNLIYQVKF